MHDLFVMDCLYEFEVVFTGLSGFWVRWVSEGSCVIEGKGLWPMCCVWS